MNIIEHDIFILLGPTASGKSSKALDVVKQSPDKFVIINSDSRQVYKELPILSACPNESEILEYDYRLYKYKSIYDSYNAAVWVKDVTNEIKSIIEKGKVPLLVGGTGFYINSLMYGLNELPQITQETKDIINKIYNDRGNGAIYEWIINADNSLKHKIQPNDSYRIFRAACVLQQAGKSITYFYNDQKKRLLGDEFKFKVFTLMPERKIIYENINKRFDEMINMGALDEVSLIDKASSCHDTTPGLKTIGLAEIRSYLSGEISFKFMKDKVTQQTRNYAKRQETWLKNSIQEKTILLNNLVK